MNINTFLLCLLVIAAYTNLYFTFLNYRKSRNKAKLPTSSKEWSRKIEQKNLKNCLSNKEKI